MVEILVTVLILAIGLLGLGAVQTLSLRHVDNAEARTHVNLLAQEVGELIRADAANASGYVVSKTSNCSAGKIQAWCLGLQNVLPGAQYSVAWDGATRTVDINIWSSEREMFVKSGDGASVDERASQFTYQVRLPE